MKKEIVKLEEQDKHPALTVVDRRRSASESQPPTIESEILSREAKIRELESSAKKIEADKADTNRMAEIRERINKLEREFAHPIPSTFKKESPEQEILDLEDELRELERKGKVLLKKGVRQQKIRGKSEEVARHATVNQLKQIFGLAENDNSDAISDRVWDRMVDLIDEQEKNVASGDKVAQAEIVGKIEAFMNEQRAEAENRKNLTPASESKTLEGNPWKVGGSARDDLWRELQDLYPNGELSSHPDVLKDISALQIKWNGRSHKKIKEH